MLLENGIANKINQLLTALNLVRAKSSYGINHEDVKKSTEPPKEGVQSIVETKLYKRRWLQLILFFILNGLNSMQWIQFTIVGNVISRYYDVSPTAVDWTSIIFQATYVVLLFPALHIMDGVGLRWACLLGSIGNSIGAWIKFFSASPDRFAVLFVGQTVVASSQIFITNVPPRLASNWFSTREVATATAIGFSGAIAGSSMFFLIIPIVVRNHENIEEIGEELSILFLAVTVVCTVMTIALLFLFQDEPEFPPSEARALQKTSRSSGNGAFWSALKRILTNKTFLVLWNSYGLNLGFYNTIGTLLNAFYIIHFQNGEADAGVLGLLMTCSGNLGSIVFGVILDKTKKFKALNIFIYALTVIGEILFAVGLIMEIKWLVFVSIAVVGIFAISHATTGIEVTAETVYPEPEEVYSGLLNMAAQLYGVILALAVGSLLRTYGDLAAHGCLTAVLTMGLISTVFTKHELKRQNAGKGIQCESQIPSPS